MYAVLIVGSVTMVYPFLLLVAGSTKSAVDTPDSYVVPPFLYDETQLYRKYMEGFFNETMEELRSCYQIEVPAFRLLEMPKKANPKFAAEWGDFISSEKLPLYFYAVSYMETGVSKGVIPKNLRLFKAEISKEFGGDINKVNSELKTQFPSWTAFTVPRENYFLKYSSVGSNLWDTKWFKFKESVPVNQRYYFNIEGFFKEMFLYPQYPKGLKQYNEMHGTKYPSWNEIHLTQRAPSSPGIELNEWNIFVRNILHPRWLRTDKKVEPLYREYLKYRYLDDIGFLNSKYGTSYESFNVIPLITGAPPEFGIKLSDWIAFIQGWKAPDSEKEYKIPAEDISIVSVVFIFRNHLEKKYGSLEKANASLDTGFRSWDEIIPPQRDFNCLDFKGRKGEIIREFIKRNFLTVFDYLVMHGRALINTFIYCCLTIICALIINPLAAYALSRFRPPSSYKVLLFLMLTMAFPPVVTQIPVFLFLREFNMLNTFFALILPGLANGYSIFLLKGFFDSLPQELYESASIDGASEIRIFLQITMSLSKPILAVIALSSFTAAYGNFMMALLVCQDKKMWTIMPFLYELQQNSGQGVIFASLLMASVPTLIIFIMCQNVIMRGIVVPVEK
jgi:multiple sugar transport system permease protein